MKRNIELPPLTHSLPAIQTRDNKDEPFDPFANPKRFHDILKQLNRTKAKHGARDAAFAQTEPNHEYIDDENEQNIKNEKLLIKIYESKYSSLFEKIRNEYGFQLSQRIPGGSKLPVPAAFTEISKSVDNKSDTTTSAALAKQRLPIRIENRGFSKFGSTHYNTTETMKDFYEKYQQFNELNRKQPLETYTPSFAFIKGANTELIVPNPLGLLKRRGDEHKLEMNNQKVGDNYMKVLSSSLKYTTHLSDLQMKGNRISSNGMECLFTSLNNNKQLLYRIHTLDISDNKIGKHDIKEMIAYIKDEKCNLENFNIAANYLGDDNIKQICDSLAENISYKLVTLNLGNNNITDSSIQSICNMIEKCSGLHVMILNLNKLTNAGGTSIIKTLRSHSEMRILDLAWNNIGSDLIREPKYEEIVNSDLNNPERKMHNFELYETRKTMRFNFRRNPLLPPLDQKGGSKKPEKKQTDTANGDKKEPLYKKPKPINVPATPVSPFASELGAYFHENAISLIHLDISHNNLPTNDAKFIAEEIKDNHTILGVHVDGNEMEIDSLGFISALEPNKKKESYFSQSQIYYDLGSDPQIMKTNIDEVRKIRSKNNCWICEGWREVKFEFKPSTPITDPNSHLVKIHLSSDNYKSFDMMYINGNFEIMRMCPPGELHYFFTVDTVPVSMKGSDIITFLKGNEFEYYFDNDYIDEYNNLMSKLAYEKNTQMEEEAKAKELADKEQAGDATAVNADDDVTKLKVGFVEPERKSEIKVLVPQVAKKQIKVNHNVINDEYRKMIKYTEPRPVKIIDRFVKPRTPWTFPVSIWAYYDYKYNGDNEDYLDQCFDFDFKRCQFHKDFNTDEKFNELRSFLRSKYRDIIDCYKYYSSFCGFTVWQITQNTLTEFISKCPNMCDKQYDINNIFLTVKVVCGNLLDRDEKINNKNKNLSDNVVRHQFMNLLVKASKDKYVMQLQTIKDHLEACKYAFENHYDAAIKGFEYHQWRKERYYNEAVDNFLQAHLPLLDGLYRSWAKQKGPRKKDVWMVLDEYNNLVQSFVDIDEYPIRDNPLYFNYSIRLQIDEIHGDKHLNMFFPEFLEGLCRAIDKASPIPPDEQIEDWSKEARAKQPLVNKLENIMPRLIKLITHPEYKYLREKFPMPPKDPATGLYKINTESPFYLGFLIPKPRPIEITEKKK